MKGVEEGRKKEDRHSEVAPMNSPFGNPHDAGTRHCKLFLSLLCTRQFEPNQGNLFIVEAVTKYLFYIPLLIHCSQHMKNSHCWDRHGWLCLRYTTQGHTNLISTQSIKRTAKTYQNSSNSDTEKIQQSKACFSRGSEPQSLVHIQPKHARESIAEPASE